MLWITGYVGSGKSTISKNIKNCHEFDEIEDLMTKDGIDLTNVNAKKFKKICKQYLSTTKVKIFNGIQAVDYYVPGDKIYFVKTGFLTSTLRSLKRDSIKRILRNLKDNLILFFELKILYIKVKHNNDLITNIEDLKIL